MSGTFTASDGTASHGSKLNPTAAIFQRLRVARAWVFDLDNTLYHPSADIFSQINRLMTEFIIREIGVDEPEAHRLRTGYWAEYGNTLAGLVAHHGVSAEDFLHQTHQLDLSSLVPDNQLSDAIATLDARRLIHTNGPRAHAARVLKARGLHDAFEQVVAIEDTRLAPKPQAVSYDRFMGMTGVEPDGAVMIEDHVENLVEPHRRGMLTVWLAHDSSAQTPDHVDLRIDSLVAFLTDVTAA